MIGRVLATIFFCVVVRALARYVVAELGGVTPKSLRELALRTSFGNRFLLMFVLFVLVGTQTEPRFWNGPLVELAIGSLYQGLMLALIAGLYEITFASRLSWHRPVRGVVARVGLLVASNFLYDRLSAKLFG